MKNVQRKSIWRTSIYQGLITLKLRCQLPAKRCRQLLTLWISLALIGSSLVAISTPANAVNACNPEIIESGGYVTLKFLDTGTCTFTTPAGTTVMQGLIVGGGGGGGTDIGGGGGGGGYVDFQTLAVTGQPLTITVGVGGSGAAPRPGALAYAGESGGNSIISGTGILLTALGGAGGASLFLSNQSPARSGGGSGGGSAGGNGAGGADLSSGESQTTQSQTPSDLASIGLRQFGNKGSRQSRVADWVPGGGGGAGSEGVTNTGNGGDGYTNDILGVPLNWAGGGGGGGVSTVAGNGGSGGGGGGGGLDGISGSGGAGLNPGTANADGHFGGSGGANTGGGGGGSTWSVWNTLQYYGGNGGSGIVVLKYLAPTSGAATRVKIARAAVGSERGAAFTTQPQIGFRDANFNTVTTSSPVVTASINNGGTLIGTTTASAISGVATFSNLGIQGVIGTTYTITYSAPGLTAATQKITLSGTTCDGSSFVCQPGDTTPHGGVIFYAPTEPFSCGADFTSLCQYLEAAPNNWKGGGVNDPDHYFKKDHIYIDGVNQDGLLVPGIAYDATANLDSSQIGLGLKNSNILSAIDTSTGNAAVASRAYNGGSKNDWYLPTLVELQLLCQFAHGQVPALGSACDFSQALNTLVPDSYTFRVAAYLSSSQNYTNWHQNFSANAYSPGEQNTWGYAATPLATRPIRAFAATVTPTKVAITRAPVGTQRRAAFSTQPQVTIQSASGVRDLSASETVTATISAGGTLVGSTTARASSGLATFSNLGVDGTIGTAYTITFTVAGLTVATTSVTPSATSCDATSFTCQVGDTGPGGGTIYYYSAAGFDCGPTQSGRCNYLEVAPNTWNSGTSDPQVAMLAVRNDSLSIPGVAQELTFNRSSADVGLGYKNSRAFKKFVNSNDSVGAGLVGTYRGGGKADWYIPSSTEIGLLCQWALGNTQNPTSGCSGSTIQRGGFTSGPYWSSSQWTDGGGHFGGYIQYFSDGSTNADQWGDANINLRPVRAFGAQPLVISVSALEGVTAPVRGATPTTSVTAGNGYTGTISWSGSPTTFEAATAYTATITLSPESGFTLTGVGANFFTVTGATTVSNSVNSGVVTAVFPATGVEPVRPDAPTGVTAVLSADSTTATISFTAPINNGGSPIISYTAYSDPSFIQSTVTQSGSGTITITGLTPGVGYSFYVYATNIVNNSNEVQSNYVGISYDGTDGSILCGTRGFFTVANKVVLNNYDCVGSVVIPEGITAIGEEAFASGSQITSLTLPSTLETIEDIAFFGLDQITTLTIPDNVTTIGNSAFQNANSLQNLVLGSGLTTIGWNAFRNATSLISLTIPNNVTTLGQGAFRNNRSLTSLAIGNGVTTIGSRAFQDAVSLNSLTIPDTVTSIGDRAFQNLSSLTSLTLGRGLRTLGFYTFSDASSLTSLRIPEGVTSISEGAFWGAWNLTSLRIPTSIETIWEDSFFTDGALQSFEYCGTLDPSVTFLYSGLDSIPFSCPASTVPGAPTSVSATLLTSTTATVSFVAPVDDGGETITTYTLTSTPAGISQTLSQSGSGTFNVTGLVVGTTYRFTVRATNSIGNSAESTLSNEIPPAQVVVPVSVPIPSPKQRSLVTEISVVTSKAGVITPVIISGNFVERIVNISISGKMLASGDWVQTPSAISLKVPALTAGQYVIQLYNGSAPIMKSFNFMVEAVAAPKPVITTTPKPVRTSRPVITTTPKPSPTPTTTKAPTKSLSEKKISTIKCVKGKSVKFVKGINPECPKGFIKK